MTDLLTDMTLTGVLTIGRNFERNYDLSCVRLLGEYWAATLLWLGLFRLDLNFSFAGHIVT